MKKVQRKNFSFTLENIDRIIKQYIIPNNRETGYEIKKSLSTKSIYVTFYRAGIRKAVRFSDHPTKKNFAFHYVGKATKEQKIVSILRNTISSLNKASLNRLFCATK